jgi:arabinosyltransferase C
LPSKQPSRAWYTPLLLIARTPQLLEARIPCRAGPPLPAADASPLVLASARHPRLVSGLEARLAGNTLVVAVGRQQLGRFPLSEGRNDDCAVQLSFAGQGWSVTDAEGERRSGRLVARLEVTGLFSQLDLRGGTRPAVRVTTQTFATTQTTRQRVAVVVAVLAALAALLLVSRARLRLPRHVLQRLAGWLRIEDAIVTVALLGWWILAPTPYDDGWVKVRQDVHAYLGEFSNYYETFGISLPLGYWLEWLERLAVSNADALAIGRIPALLALFACWALARAATRICLGHTAEGRTARAVLTTVSVLSAVAWGMTLRPEPFVAALLGASLLAALLFVRRPSPVPLAACAPVIALGFTAHPAGLATAAPLLAVSPAIVRWARHDGATAWLALTAGALATGALALTLLTLDADLETRRHGAHVFRTGGGYVFGYRDELSRYWTVLSTSPSIQRLFLLLVFLTLVVLVTRRRRPRTPLMDVPARTLAIAMLLLAFTPSKISWHLGMLMVAATVALTVEAVRLARDGAHSTWRSARAYGAVAALLAFAWWAWRERGLGGRLDVRTEGLRLRTEDWVTLTQMTVGIASLAVAFVIVRHVRRRGQVGLHTAAPAALPLVLLVVAIPFPVFVFDRIVEDALFTEGWTLARQNVDTLLGRPTCGLADDALVPDRATFTPLRLAEPDATRGSVVRARSAAAVTPWYRLPDNRRVGFAVQGFPGTESPIVVEWGAGAGIVGHSSVALEERRTVGDPRLGTRYLPWRFVSQGDLSSRPGNATLARIRVPGAVAGGVAVAPPVAYETTSIRTLTGRAPQLVQPNYRVVLPCARLPRLEGGVHGVPHTLALERFSGYPSVHGSGTAYGLLDLYRFEYLPSSDSPRRTGSLRIYVVDPRIPGTALAPAVRVRA